MAVVSSPNAGLTNPRKNALRRSLGCATSPNVHQFLQPVADRNPGQPEFLQAVTEVMERLWPFIEKHPKYAEQGLLHRLVESERLVMFRVCGVDDHGDVQVNRGYRVQHSMVIDSGGFTPEKRAILMDIKNHHYRRVSDYARTGAQEGGLLFLGEVEIVNMRPPARVRLGSPNCARRA
jgi:hypothetical protein